MHKKSAPGPLGRERLDIGGLGNRLADEDFFGLLAVHADVEAVFGVGYAYALQVEVFNRRICVVGDDIADTLSFGSDVEIKGDA